MKPDVIVHARKRKEENLVVIEAKKSGQWTRGWPEVAQKLKAFTCKAGKYEYRIGIAWKIEASQEPAEHVAVWFCDGEELCRTKVVDFVNEVLAAIKAKAEKMSHVY